MLPPVELQIGQIKEIKGKRQFFFAIAYIALL